MPKKILVADDDEDVRRSHKLALDAAGELLKDPCVVVESDDSVDAWAKIKAEKFDLILVDNDFKDKEIKGHLPGIALLQLARREGANRETPIIFCSGETFETLKPMVEKFNAVHLPKADLDIDKASRLYASQLTRPKAP
ncbi:MAG TPA: response regulator [Bacteroidota bacterium]|nr:response regulator [Bacteroidota bacterium]